MCSVQCARQNTVSFSGQFSIWTYISFICVFPLSICLSICLTVCYMRMRWLHDPGLLSCVRVCSVYLSIFFICSSVSIYLCIYPFIFIYLFDYLFIYLSVSTSKVQELYNSDKVIKRTQHPPSPSTPRYFFNSWIFNILARPRRFRSPRFTLRMGSNTIWMLQPVVQLGGRTIRSFFSSEIKFILFKSWI